jgi:D-alanyl-D-alanine carboxypeptidase
VVLGAPSSAARTGRAAQMFERGFASNPLSWLTPSLGSVNALVPIATDPPNLREEICGKHHHRPGVDDDDDSAAASADDPGGQRSFLLSSLRSPTPKASALLTSGLASPPIDVHVGPPHKPGSPSAAMATIEPVKRKPIGAAVAGKPAPAALAAKPLATKPIAHAAVAPPRAAEPAATAASFLKPWPTDTTVAKPAAAKPAATDKPKPTAALQPKPPGAAVKPAGAPELKPTIATDAPKPKPTAVKSKPAAPPAPPAPRTEAQ